jgi:hypothetical protein
MFSRRHLAIASGGDDLSKLEVRPEIEPGENWEQTTRTGDQDIYDYWEVRYYWIVGSDIP